MKAKLLLLLRMGLQMGLMGLMGAPACLAETSFDVVLKKKFWPDGHGVLVVSDDAIEFRTHDDKNSRRWSYQDIQYFDRVSRQEIIVLTYEDSGWKLGRDRQFRFVLSEGEFTAALFDQVSRGIGRPVTNRVFEVTEEVEAELPVKHLHALGGCEGTLLFTDNEVYYRTSHARDARQWQLRRDVDSVWSHDRYHLELHVYDNNRREFSRAKVYKFDLKRPLDPEWYRGLKLRLYELNARERSPIGR